MPLYRIVFFSILKVGNLSQPTAEIEAVLRDARAWRDKTITGAFVHGDFYFAGVIEGRRRYVSECHAAFVGDRRHVAVQLVSAGPIGERLFDDIETVDIAADAAARRLIARFGPASHFTPADMAPSSLLTFVRQLTSSDGAPKIVEVEELAWDSTFRLPEPNDGGR